MRFVNENSNLKESSDQKMKNLLKASLEMNRSSSNLTKEQEAALERRAAIERKMQEKGKEL